MPEDATLDDELNPFLPGIVSLTGGGGKTTLLFALAERLTSLGKPALCTTTTRMLLPRESDWLSVRIGTPPPGLNDLILPETGALFAALPPEREPDAAAGKVCGFPPDLLDDCARSNPSQCILVEADGAARKPVKAPADHEPVLPRLTTAAVAVIGLRCMGEPLSGAIAFRPERIAAATGLNQGDVITPAAVARLAVHPAGLFKNVPETAARLLFCNQSDLPGAEAAGGELAAMLVCQAPGFLHGIYCGSLLTKGLACLSFPVR